MINKKTNEGNKISVDHIRQHQEKNTNWQDYPCINIVTSRKLKHNLGYYFGSWKEYCQHGYDTNYETKGVKN